MPQTFLNESQRLRAQGQFEEALAVLDSGQEHAPHCLDFPAIRAQILNDMGRYREALEESWRVLATNEPTQAHEAARFAQGYALLMLGQLEEATLALDALLALNPRYPDAAWLRAGTLRQRFGDLHPQILAAYDQATDLDPTNLYMQVERADLLRTNGRYAEARDLLVNLQSPDACPDEELRLEASFKLGCVAAVLNESTTARAAFRSVLAVAPDYPDAEAMLALLEQE